MKIEEALKELFESDSFKQEARTNSNLRVYLLRYRNNQLKEASAKRLLLEFGYKEDYKSPFKKKS